MFRGRPPALLLTSSTHQLPSHPILSHQHFVKMVAFTRLALAFSAVVAALAAPTTELVGELPDFELGPGNLTRRQDYTQNYKTSGNVNFSPTNNGYSVQFSGAQDFVVGKGWSKGTSRYVFPAMQTLRPVLTTPEPSTSPAAPVPPPEPCSSPCTDGRRTH